VFLAREKVLVGGSKIPTKVLKIKDNTEKKEERE